ncbi:MAG: DUF1700 domain-containing protein [Eubacteriales bacterium]
MNKKEFLYKMNFNLLAISDDERNKIINFYEEMIEDYVENGLSEEEAIEKIGDPQQIIRKNLDENDELTTVLSPVNGIFKGFFKILMLPIVGVLLLAFYITLVSIPITILFCEVTVAVVAVVSIIGCPFVAFHYNIPVGIMQLGFGIICTGIFFLLNQAFVICWINVLVILKKTNRKVILSLRGGNDEKK